MARKQNEKKAPPRRPATPEELEVARDLIQKAITKGGPDALSNIRPLAVRATLQDGEDAKQNETYLNRCVQVETCVNPLFDSVMLALGFDRLGERSYAIGAGEKMPKKILRSMLEAIPGSMLRSGRGAERVHQAGLDHNSYSSRSAWEIHHELQRCPGGAKLDYSDIQSAMFNSGGYSSYRSHWASDTDERYQEHSLVSLSTNGSQIIVSVHSAWVQHRGKKGLFFWDGAPDLHLLRVKGRRDPVLTTPAEAVAILESASAWGFPVVDGGGMRTLRSGVGTMLLVERVPGSPGEARIVVGAKALDKLPQKSAELLTVLGDSKITAYDTTAKEATEFANACSRKRSIVTITDPQISDVMSMEKARATGGRKPLRPYQDEAVSLHLSTDYGYVNACAPGLGKTLMALFAQREKALKMDGYRSLVVCPAAIRSQWIREAGRFFPEAEVATWTGQRLKKELPGFLQSAGKKPAIVFLSYDAMRAGAEELQKTAWNDLICDEAAILGSTGTARTKALWDLRRVSDVAVALTGTPINRSLDDLGYIVSWVRGDETAFHGQKLSKRFDMAEDEDVEGLWRALGPTVFRRDRSEIADQLPEIDTEVITLDPEPSELKLANGAREELRKIYDTLQKKLEVAESLRPNDPALKKAREDMKKVRGAVLGGVTLARMAACDPASLRGKKSKSAGVALLEAAGLVEPAIKNGGTKRTLVCGLTEDLVNRGDAVLIFTDFSTVAEALASDLRAKGLQVGTFTGGGGKKRDQAALDFQSGKLDVLVLTGAGREGLNLQRASVLVHYDLPWVPSQVVQRVGRASRFGSTSSRLSVLIPIMAGTIEERVAALLVPRAVEALRALDSHRGVKGAETEVGLAVAGLQDAVPDEVQQGEQSGLFSLAEQVLGDQPLHLGDPDSNLPKP